MKRLLFLGAGGALLFMMGGVGPAQADNGPHISTAVTEATLPDGASTPVGANGCAGCHRVHTAKSADGMLLKTTTQKELCYTCHGTGGSGAITDVQGGYGYDGTNGALRSGGFEKALIDTNGGNAKYAVGSHGLRPNTQNIPTLAKSDAQVTTSSHSIDGSPQTIWGNGAISATADVGKAGVNLACGSCHDPHGNKNYRILKPVPNDSDADEAVIQVPAKAAVVADPNAVPPVVGSPAVAAVMTGTTGVAIPDQPAKVYTTTDYWQTLAPGVPALSGKTGLPVVSPDGFIANISDWCLTCHTRYEGQSGARRTDSGDAIFTYRHTTAKIDVNGTRNCITCHVAHGSNATMERESANVEMPGGAVPTTGNTSDSRLLRMDGRGVCVMCHNY